MYTAVDRVLHWSIWRGQEIWTDGPGFLSDLVGEMALQLVTEPVHDFTRRVIFGSTEVFTVPRAGK